MRSKFFRSLRKRSAEALRRVDCRYFGPHVGGLISEFVREANAIGQNGLVLFVDHELGGGANLYRKNWLRQTQDEGKAVLLWTYDYPARQHVVECICANAGKPIRLYSLDCVKSLLLGIQCIDQVVVSELVSFPDPLLIQDALVDLKDRVGAKLSLLIHDYYSVCPGATLIDWTGRYCGPSLDQQRCAICLQHLNLHIKTGMGAVRDIERWRFSWGSLLMQSDSIVCFSASSRDIMQAVYPEVSMDRYVVQPHDCSHIQQSLQKAPPLRIGVMGQIDAQKGASILRKMVSIVELQQLQVFFVVIGSVQPPIKSRRLFETGRYRHEDLFVVISLFNIDVFLIPSISPETFSYTTEEIILAGKPLAVFNLGAPAERVRRYPKGLVLSSMDPAAALYELRRFARSIDGACC
jgi:glycosyltransferase involved in cell wall biosynthesis